MLRKLRLRQKKWFSIKKTCRSNYSNSKIRKRQHKKRKINNSTAGEILTEKHNENQAI